MNPLAVLPLPLAIGLTPIEVDGARISVEVERPSGEWIRLVVLGASEKHAVTLRALGLVPLFDGLAWIKRGPAASRHDGGLS